MILKDVLILPNLQYILKRNALKNKLYVCHRV